MVVCDDPQDFGRVGTRAGPSLPSLCILTEITHYSFVPPVASRLLRRGPAETELGKPDKLCLRGVVLQRRCMRI